MSSANKSKNPIDSKPKELDLGERKISRMNFSYILTIPKVFVKNSPFGDITMVRIVMLEDGYLKIIPVRGRNEAPEFAVM